MFRNGLWKALLVNNLQGATEACGMVRTTVERTGQTFMKHDEPPISVFTRVNKWEIKWALRLELAVDDEAITKTVKYDTNAGQRERIGTVLAFRQQAG